LTPKTGSIVINLITFLHIYRLNLQNQHPLPLRPWKRLFTLTPMIWLYHPLYIVWSYRPLPSNLLSSQNPKISHHQSYLLLFLMAIKTTSTFSPHIQLSALISNPLHPETWLIHSRPTLHSSVSSSPTILPPSDPSILPHALPKHIYKNCSIPSHGYNLWSIYTPPSSLYSS
jgi:hypothetical protein